MKVVIACAFSDFLSAQFRFSLQLLLCLLILGGGGAAITSAQTVTTTKPTDGSTPSALEPGAPAGSYALSDFENINIFNGAVNFHLPLLQIGGRGGAGYTMTLPIERKWEIEHIVTDRNLGCESCDTFPLEHAYKPILAIFEWGGMDPRLRYTPGILTGSTVGDDYRVPCFSNAKGPLRALTRLTFSAADGTEYELRDQLNEGKPLQPPSCLTGSSRGTVFKTGDGSSATFISDTPINDNPLGGGPPLRPSGHLFLKDGTRYRIVEGWVREIRDRNGNRVEFDYSTSEARKLIIRDSMNRQVTVTLAFGSTPYDEISFKGAGGATRAIRVWRDSLSNRLRPANAQRPAEVLNTVRGLFPTLTGQFPTSDGSIDSYFNPGVISAVELPDGRQYQFYYNSYGELAKVRLPTGGGMEYDYQNTDGVVALGAEYGVYRRAVKRRVYRDDNTLESSMEISDNLAPQLGSVFLAKQFDQDGQLLSATKHYFYGSAEPSLFKLPIYYSAWNEGKEYKTETLAADGLTVLRMVEHTWQQRANIFGWQPVFGPEPGNDPRIVETVTTLADANLVSKQAFGYDQYNNQTDVYDYDFGVGAPGALIRRTQTSYLTTNPNQGGVNYATDLNIHIRNLSVQQIVYDASGNVRSQTDFSYDNYGGDYPLVHRPGIVQHDSGFHTGYGTRGNLTEVIHYNPGGSPSEIHLNNQYDIAGNVVKTIDGRRNSTDIAYEDCFGPPGDDARSNSGPPELAGGFTYAFPTRVTNALTPGHTTYTKYDYYLGKPVAMEDANGIVSSVAYNDALDRPTQGIQARYKVGVGVPIERRQTTFTYDDVNRVITTTGDRTTFNDNILTGKSYYDGLGRKRRGAVYEGSTWSITDTRFDALGRVSHVSSPYRAGDPDSASAPDDLWTETVYDSLGRAVDVETPDGAHVITQYTGNQALVVDQAGKRRLSETDALGRLIRITEDPGNLNYETYYTYDALGNLRVVTQHGQLRTFAYDALSRLISATNPESGTVTYAYDANGNLVEKTDARGVKTTMTYDALNRVRSKVYTGTTPEGTIVANATPAVNYFYDDYSTAPSGAPSWPGTPSKGRLIGVTYGAGSEGTYYKYDAAGRIITNHQRQGTSNYATNYTYNLAGGVTREQRGNYINNVWKEYFRNSWTYDDAGRISGMQASLTPFLSFVTLVGNISYAPFGALQSETYGNGLIHSIGYNERQQPTEIRLGRPGNLESVFTIYYMYGIAHNVNDPDPEIAPIHNNGNIARVRYSVSGTVQYAQTFQYDTLNRIRYAVEHNNGAYNDGNRAWYQTFDYDRYGNRGINVANTSDNADAANSALQLADFSESNNRITRAGFIYDAAGNLIAEPGKSYTYDGENRMITATVDGAPTSQYVYDGNSRRVKKTVGGVGTRFEYGAGGELIAERNDATGTVTKVYCYKGGELLATTTNGTVYEYATADHLGTPRAWTNGSGNLVSGGRHDYLPFGEELFAGVGTRTTDQGYATTTQVDGQRKQFGSKERDIETKLDYFLARYYSSLQGRFTSPDEFTGGPVELFYFAEDATDNPTFYADLANPQSLNKYQYTYNNPLRYTDPTGHCPKCVKAAVKTGIKSIIKGKVDWGEVADVADAVSTIIDPDSSLLEKGLAVFDVVSPVSSKELKAVDKFLDNTDFVKDAQKAIGKLHKNSNDAESHYILYEVYDANGMPLKIGVADAERTTAAGDPVRMKHSERKARKQYPGASATVVKDLGVTTKGKAKESEAAEVRGRRAEGNPMPLNKERDKRYHNNSQ